MSAFDPKRTFAVALKSQTLPELTESLKKRQGGLREGDLMLFRCLDPFCRDCPLASFQIKLCPAGAYSLARASGRKYEKLPRPKPSGLEAGRRPPRQPRGMVLSVEVESMHGKMTTYLTLGLLLAMGIATSAFAAGDPTRLSVRDYLASCDNNSQKGSDCMIVVNVIQVVNSSGTCLPEAPDSDEESDAQSKQITTVVVKWLHEHSVPQNLDASQAVVIALGALYPCNK